MTRILIVEDSPTQADAVAYVLQENGFDVTIAPDGEQGFRLFSTSDFELVISDIVMPGISGYELCSQIKGSAAKSGVPVVLLTMLKDPVDILKGIECGADNFITKPYGPEQLVYRVRQALANRALAADEHGEAAGFSFLGKTFTITADKRQVMGLLLSTYEDIVRTNQELEQCHAALVESRRNLERYTHLLESRIRHVEEKYRSFMKHATDAIFLMDSAGKILEINNRASTLLGLPWIEVIGHGFSEFLFARESESFAAFLDTTLRRGAGRWEQLSVKGPGGLPVSIEVGVSVVEADNGKAMLAIIREPAEAAEVDPGKKEGVSVMSAPQAAPALTLELPAPAWTRGG